MPVAQTEHEVVISAHDSVVKVALIGATVYSWTSLGEERFFKSRKSPVEGPAAVRGGIPVVWPTFGPPPKEPPFDKLKQHGFARTSIWKYVGQTANGAGAEFSLKPTPEIKQIYEPDFELLYTVDIVDSKTLSTWLRVKNPSSSAKLRFQFLVHNYFLLPAGATLDDVSVSPLSGLSYRDKTLGGKVSTQKTSEVKLNGETDRVYQHAGDQIKLSYGGKGGIKVLKRNLPDIVYWNPGQEKGESIGDMEPGGWLRFVCVEPGTATDFIELEAGGTWEGGQSLQVEAA